jgi:hypothetical protein
MIGNNDYNNGLNKKSRSSLPVKETHTVILQIVLPLTCNKMLAQTRKKFIILQKKNFRCNMGPV